MTAQRRDTDRETAESTARIWQIYADQIGLPKARSTPNEQVLSRPSDPLRPAPPRRRLTMKSAGGVVAVAGMGVAVLAAIASRSDFRTLLGPVEHRSPMPVSGPVDSTNKTAQRSESSKPAGDGRQAAAPDFPTPTEPVDPARRQRTPDDSISPPTTPGPSPVAGYQPDTTGTSNTPLVETKPEPANVMHRINFHFASDRITDESKRTLDKIVAAMKANPDWRVAIEGHTDAHGPPEYNSALSERRALAAKTYLEAAGISPRRLSAIGLGASRPVAPNAGLLTSLNRRVEFHRL